MMMKRLQLLLLLLLPSLMGQAANDMDKHLPANWGGWQNLSCSVNDTTYYTSDLLPMQAAVSGQTLHVFWPDWKPNAQGETCVYYRRSADAGRTWEEARTVIKSKNFSMVDINYAGGSFGSNSKWYAVEGQNVHLVTIVRSDDDQNSELLYTYSHDGGQTFQQRTLAKGSEGDGHYNYGRPHVVADGQTLVIAFQRARYNNNDYKTRVLTSFDGGATFTDKEIDMTQNLADVQVSGRRWAVLGSDSYWNYNMWWGNVYYSTSTDGGQTISTQNIAPILQNDKSWCELNYMKGYNGESFNYHPQMTLEGDVVNIIFKGCIDKEEEHPEYNGSRAHTVFRRSTDGGKTWTEAKYLPGTTGTTGAIAARGQHIYVLQNPNGPKIWYSHDGGQTWNIQERCYWPGRYDGYGNFYELYVAPDDPTGQHVYLTGVRALLVESKDGFRSVHRNFAMGTESWDSKNRNNQSLTVLMDSEGTEHWLMHYSSPYKPFESYFWNIVYRRNDQPSTTTGKEMALDISKVEEQKIDRPMTNLTIPMTPSLMETQEATTVECWVRVDQGTSFQIASLTNDLPDYEGSRYRGGWYIKVGSDYSDYFSFEGGVSTELSVDGTGKAIWDRWRYQIKEWGLWHHVALTYDSNVEKDNLRLYADGLLIGKATERGKLRIGNNPIVIGRSSNYSGPKGLVDNFAIYSRALSQAELQQHLYDKPDAKDKDCRLLLTFDGSMQDQSQYHNDPVPIMEANLVEHDGIRPPHPEFTLTKNMQGQVVYGTDMTQDGEAYWWIMPYPSNPSTYDTSKNQHVSKDFARYPGTYSFTMAAKGTGNSNAFASLTKSITIGGLSRVFPDIAGQADGVKLRIQGGYKLTYYDKPRVALHGANGDIEGTWDVVYGYDSEKITSADDLAPAVFNLTEAATGKYDVIVGTDTLRQAFTLEKSEEPDVWMQINGRGAGLWNKYQRYTIEYGNTSNTAAYNTPIVIVIPERHGTVDVSFDFDFYLCDPALDDKAQEWARQMGDHIKVYDEQTKDSIRVYSFMIPYIAPNSTNQRSFRIKMAPGTNEPSAEIKIGYWIEQPWGPNNSANGATTRAPFTLEQGECFAKEWASAVFDTAISFIPGASCISSIAKAGYSTATGAEGKWSTLFLNAADVFFNCGSEVIPGSSLVKGLYNFGSKAWDLYSKYKSIKDMRGCLKGDPNEIGNKGRGSYDPNEMIGPSGYDDHYHFIKPIHQMAYTITFENKSTATAPAHEVFVTDTLDATKYDLSTFAFTSYGWADTTLVVGGSKTQEFTRDIMYRVKEQDIRVRVSGQFDPQTGIASWAFVSLKTNGDEIDDPDLGFLVPNNDNRDGEGFVSFSIEHKAAPASGSEVSNRATIIFDANAPIVTNTYVNTFDTDYPTSKVTKVEERNQQLVVTVEGSDATSGIECYNLYVFKDGGEPELAATITSGSTATIACQPGTRYGFCSLATDHVGWNEPKSLTVEKELTTSGTSPQAKTISLAIAEAGYATFYDSEDNYTLPDGLKASIVSGVNGSRLNYQTLNGSVIPKGTAVLIEATQKKAATYTLTSTTTADASAIGNNLLHGSNSATTTSGDANSLFYKLSYGPSNTSLATSFGWFWGAQNGAAFRIDGHRAWLALPRQAASRAYLISGDATGIEDFAEEPAETSYTDLQGRHVKQPAQPGIYIQNGRKVIIK